MDKIELDYTLENLEKIRKMLATSGAQAENHIIAATLAATSESKLSAYNEALRWNRLRLSYTEWITGFYAELERIMDEKY